MATKDPIEAFMKIGLAEAKAKETSKNSSLTSTLLLIIEEAGATEGVDKAIGLLYYFLASKLPKKHNAEHRKLVTNYIKSGQLKNVSQVEAALSFIESRQHDDELNIPELEKAAGVGVVVTDEQMCKVIDDVIAAHMAELKEERYSIAHLILKEVNSHPDMKWADGKSLKQKFDEKILAMLGPKTAEDEKTKAKRPAKPKELSTPTSSPAPLTSTREKDDVPQPEREFSMPEDNKLNHPSVLAKHLAATGGKVMTRFPPEPNGHLHIGHAKAMFLDFGLAKKNGGHTYLRFDDTNPEAEKLEYITNIQEIVRWLGHEPYKVTMASGYYQEMYDFAVQLIKEGKAYIDHQSSEEMSKGRETHTDSPWRNRPIEESLREFERMRRGEYDEGEAVLRMKMDMKSENPCMHDLVAYRVKFTAHPLAGDKWCVYPSYDFEHCIVDSIENITHSLCTKEFEIRRESYYWLLDALHLYKPIVWEFSRLNLTHTMMSKRKLHRLIHEKYVHGWDDPRLPTLLGMKRRGYSPKAINAFCEAIGISRTENLIRMELLEHCVRKDMDGTARRAFCVVEPLKVIVTNWDNSKRLEIEAPNHPKDPSMGTRKMILTRVLYIEKEDFRLQDTKDFFGLAPGKSVMLRYACKITHKNTVLDPKTGEIMYLEVEASDAIGVDTKKEKMGIIHWVSDPSPGKQPLKIQLNLYEHLFKSEDVNEVTNYLTDLNPDSLKVLNGLGEPFLADLEVGTPVQFERVGFFVPDTESSSRNVIYNRTVSLYETKDVKKARA